MQPLNTAMVACICHLIFFCHNTIFFQKILCCDKLATTQYFLKKYCVVTNLPQHNIFFKKYCVVATLPQHNIFSKSNVL